MSILQTFHAWLGPTVTEAIASFVVASQVVFFSYFLGLTVLYLGQNVVAHVHMRRTRGVRWTQALPNYSAGLEPGITLLVPAYNEEAVIVASVLSTLQIDYPTYEVIIVNDGSKDKTLQVAIEAFDMVRVPHLPDMPIATKPVRGVYRSRRFPNLKMVDKDNGGKADAMNSAVNVSQYALVCALDADSIVQRDGLIKLVRPFLEDRRVIASGGTIRIANGCQINQGFLERVDMPTSWLARFQVVEYLRAFLFGRVGWMPLNAVLIVSGAYGLFRKRTMIDVGGFSHNTIGEDMELTVRLHRILRARGEPYRIVYVPESVCWTEAPEDWSVLRSQRIRWQRGLIESMKMNRDLLFARKSGAVGWLAYPSFLFLEAAGPIIEVLGMAVMLLGVLMGMIALSTFLMMMGLVLAIGILLSTSAILLEEAHFATYPKRRHLLMLLLVLVVENLGYRQANSWWRIVGTWRWMRGKTQAWGTMTRKGLGSTTTP